MPQSKPKDVMENKGRLKLNNVEAARGIAACIVVFYHVSRHIWKETGIMPYNSAFQFGHSGVEFFFVLSGFIIMHIHYDDIGNRGKLISFMLKRILRLYPTFWFILLITIIIFIATGKNLPEIQTMIADFFLMPSESLVDVAWTLKHEVIFYAFFSAMIFFPIFGIIGLAFWFTASIISAYITVVMATPISGLGSAAIFISPYNALFFMGILVAIVCRKYQIKYSGTILLCGASMFATVAVCENMGIINGYRPIATMLYGLSAMICMFGLIGTERQKLFSFPKIMIFLGSCSYSIYLVHLLSFGIANKLMLLMVPIEAINPTVRFALLVFSGIAGGVVVSVLFEQPLLKRSRRWLGHILNSNSARPQQTLQHVRIQSQSRK